MLFYLWVIAYFRHLFKTWVPEVSKSGPESEWKLIEDGGLWGYVKFLEWTWKGEGELLKWTRKLGRLSKWINQLGKLQGRTWRWGVQAFKTDKQTKQKRGSHFGFQAWIWTLKPPVILNLFSFLSKNSAFSKFLLKKSGEGKNIPGCFICKAFLVQ